MWIGKNPVYKNNIQVAEIIKNLEFYTIRNLRPNGTVGVCYTDKDTKKIKEWLDTEYPGWTRGESMTDQQKLIVLLTEWGVEFDISARLSHINPKYGSGISITCRTGKGKIDGYGGFCTIFEFDEDEKFIEMGVWE